MASSSRVENSLEPWRELNKVVMVTGASSGLGREFCLDLAKAGCRIVAAARGFEKLKSVCDQINTEFPLIGSDKTSEHQSRAVAVELDITASEDVIKARVQTAWEIFGTIDVLINNAGIRERSHSPLDLTEEEWRNVVRTNQTGTYLMSKHVAILMRESKQGGSIINVSSISGLSRTQFHRGHAYSASKYAVNSITKVMAMELGQYNIRVNSIAPAIFESGITKGLIKKDWYQRIISMSAAVPTEGPLFPGLTSTARYLMHEASQYVTGNVFIVDCGITLRGIPLYSFL